MILFISFVNMLGTKVSSKLFCANNFFSLKCSVVNLINAGLFTFKAETLKENNFKMLMQWNIPQWNKTDMLIKQKPKKRKKVFDFANKHYYFTSSYFYFCFEMCVFFTTSFTLQMSHLSFKLLQLKILHNQMKRVFTK